MESRRREDGWIMRIASIVLLGVAAAAPSRADDWPERTKSLIEALRAVPADAASGSEAFARVDAFFDFDSFANECLGASAGKFSPTERKEFTQRMADVVRRGG